ncbi:MAG: zeta toxin family protein [Peptostreptococcaceae bacterium]
MKRYTLFAGVNGAGKTTMYNTVYVNNNREEPRINTDEMVAGLGSWEDNSLQIKCAREAALFIRKYFEEGISFNQETTLTGRSIIKNIIDAKSKGFYVRMNYIALSSPDVAKGRVRDRVSKGGHGIPDETIERRYYESLKNLSSVIDICDEIVIYDNTYECEELIRFHLGKQTYRKEVIPDWLSVYIN